MRADDSDAEEAGLGGSADKPFAGGTRPAYGAGLSHASHRPGHWYVTSNTTLANPWGACF